MSNIDINEIIKSKINQQDELNSIATSLIGITNNLNKIYGIISSEDNVSIQKILDKIGSVNKYIDREIKYYQDLELKNISEKESEEGEG